MSKRERKPRTKRSKASEVIPTDRVRGPRKSPIEVLVSLTGCTEAEARKQLGYSPARPRRISGLEAQVFRRFLAYRDSNGHTENSSAIDALLVAAGF